MTVTIVETRTQARAITGGVDTHADAHVAAALDALGGLLGVREFPATAAGYARLLEWLGGFGPAGLAGMGGPAVTALGSPGTSPRPASGSSRWTARTGSTGAVRASPTRRCGQRCPGRSVRPGGRRAEGP
jgi:hypothetical protein